MTKNLVFLSMLLLAGPVFGVDWPSLEKTAKARHPEVRAYQAEVESAEDLASASRGEFLPQISLFADRGREESRQKILGVNTLTDSSSEGYGVQARWSLFSGFSGVGRARRSQALASRTRAQASAAWLKARVELRKAYDGALLSQESRRVYENLRKRYRDQVKVIEAKYRSGLESRWAVDLAQSNPSLVEANLSSEELSFEKAMEILARLTGEDDLVGANQDALEADARFEKSLQPERPVFDVENHPEWRAAQADSENAKAEVTVARATYWPALDFSWQTGMSLPEGRERVQNTAYRFTLSYTIFEGLSGMRNDSAARARFRAKEIRSDETWKILREQEDQLWRQLAVNRKQLEARRMELQGARAYAEATNLQYRQGSRKFAEWDTAQTRLMQAEREHLSARRQWLASYADWEQAAGLFGEEM